MKQSLITLVIGATMAFGAAAQDESGTGGAAGGVTAGVVGTAAVGLGVLAAVVSNNRGSADIDDGVVDPDPTCNDGDDLVDGSCVGSTTTLTETVTVSGTQTVSITVPVSVSYTYAPSAAQ